MDFKNIIHR